jgi:hypothetical protein
METSGDVDLAPVRAKIKAQDYKGALAELRDLAEDTQNADVYNLLGLTLRKTGDLRRRFPATGRRLTCSPSTKPRGNIWRALCPGRPDGQGEGVARRAREALSNSCDERIWRNRSLSERPINPLNAAL